MLRAHFDSPIREMCAKTELLRLKQKKGEDACTYMARTRSLMHRVPGFDEKTALIKWIYGLRRPFCIEAIKVGPKTLAEAEILVVHMEDALKGRKCDDQQKKKSQRGKHAGNSGRNLRRQSKTQKPSKRKQGRIFHDIARY